MTSGMCAGISPPARRPDHHFAKELEQLLRNLSINAMYRKLPEKIQVSCQASAYKNNQNMAVNFSSARQRRSVWRRRVGAAF